MMNFCTLFDSYYIHKGIALYLSLEKVTDDFHLYVMAFDRDCYKKLKSFGFKHMTVDCWCDYEVGRIHEIKEERTRAEYCWSCGPSVIHHFLTAYDLPSVTYLDSDLYFLSNPKIVFDEIRDNSIAITEQGISETMAALYGRYCVQFMYFKNDEFGMAALTWWRDSCLEWCYQRFEDGKYADQKYIDQFPIRFNGVHVVKNLGAGIAPWNMHRYEYKDNYISIDDKEFPMVFFHMHGIKFSEDNDSLTLRSFDFYINENDKRAFFNGYGDLALHVYNHYFNKALASYNVSGIKGLTRLVYFFRNLLRDNKLVQFLYFKVIKHEYKGHGNKIG